MELHAILLRPLGSLFRGGSGRFDCNRAAQNRKGRDCGYALATGSCEEANSVDACTVTTLDVITAFAVPNLNCPSQDQSIFSGLAASRVAPLDLSLSLLRTGNDLFLPTLSTVDGSKLNTCN